MIKEKKKKKDVPGPAACAHVVLQRAATLTYNTHNHRLTNSTERQCLKMETLMV